MWEKIVAAGLVFGLAVLVGCKNQDDKKGIDTVSEYEIIAGQADYVRTDGAEIVLKISNDERKLSLVGVVPLESRLNLFQHSTDTLLNSAEFIRIQKAKDEQGNVIEGAVWLFADGELVQKKLAEEGVVKVNEPPTLYASELWEAENSARVYKRGIWAFTAL